MNIMANSNEENNDIHEELFNKSWEFLKDLTTNPEYDNHSDPVISSYATCVSAFCNKNITENTEEIHMNLLAHAVPDPNMGILGIPMINKIAKEIHDTNVKKKTKAIINKPKRMKAIDKTNPFTSKKSRKTKKLVQRFTLINGGTSCYNFSVKLYPRKDKKNSNKISQGSHSIFDETQQKFHYMTETFKNIRYIHDTKKYKCMKIANESVFKLQIVPPLIDVDHIPLLDKPSYFFEQQHIRIYMYRSSYASIIQHINEKEKKTFMNNKFKEKFPSCRITLSKLRSVKRKMYLFGSKHNLDECVIAHSLLFFERLVFLGFATKTTRKAIACCSLLIATKIFQDNVRNNISKFINYAVNEFRITYKAIIDHEFLTVLGLNFSSKASIKTIKTILNSVKDSIRKK